MSKFTGGFYKHDPSQLTAHGRRDARNLMKQLNKYPGFPLHPSQQPNFQRPKWYHPHRMVSKIAGFIQTVEAKVYHK